MNFEVMGINFLNFITAGFLCHIAKVSIVSKCSLLKIFLSNVSISLISVVSSLFVIPTKLCGKCPHFILGGHWLGGVMCICFN